MCVFVIVYPQNCFVCIRVRGIISPREECHIKRNTDGKEAFLFYAVWTVYVADTEYPSAYGKLPWQWNPGHSVSCEVPVLRFNVTSFVLLQFGNILLCQGEKVFRRKLVPCLKPNFKDACACMSPSWISSDKCYLINSWEARYEVQAIK
jgi:hypothetical protein